MTANLTALYTILQREMTRFLRIWIQTIVPPAITTTLYFAIFGSLIGPRIGPMQGVDYSLYIAPGLIMMAIITNAYANVASSFYSMRFQRNIEELLVTPTPNWIIVAGFTCGGVARGLIVGITVSIVASFFVKLQVSHIFLMLGIMLMSATLFSLAGFTNGVFARKFDDISIVPTFILTPLTYLGGVFYSISMLPSVWQSISSLNPIIYIVNSFRYGILGVSDVNVGLSFTIVGLFIAILFSLNVYLLNRGVGIRQ